MLPHDERAPGQIADALADLGLFQRCRSLPRRGNQSDRIWESFLDPAVDQLGDLDIAVEFESRIPADIDGDARTKAAAGLLVRQRAAVP